MEREEYEKMAEFEDRIWWYHALDASLLYVLKRALPNLWSSVLDAGCGAGGFLIWLQHAFPDIRAIGLVIYREVLVYARNKGGASVILGSVNGLPFRDRFALRWLGSCGGS